MPWILIPILFLLGFAAEGLYGHCYIFIAIAAWLGYRYRYRGMLTALFAGLPYFIYIYIDTFYTFGDASYLILAVVVACLTAKAASGEQLLELARARIWLVMFPLISFSFSINLGGPVGIGFYLHLFYFVWLIATFFGMSGMRLRTVVFYTVGLIALGIAEDVSGPVSIETDMFRLRYIGFEAMDLVTVTLFWCFGKALIDPNFRVGEILKYARYAALILPVFSFLTIGISLEFGDFPYYHQLGGSTYIAVASGLLIGIISGGRGAMLFLFSCMFFIVFELIFFAVIEDPSWQLGILNFESNSASRQASRFIIAGIFSITGIEIRALLDSKLSNGRKSEDTEPVPA